MELEVVQNRTVPSHGRGFYTALHELQIDRAVIVAPV